MELNTTQEFDFLGAYQTCLKAMETDEFTGSLCKYYLEITEALRIAMKNQGRQKGYWIAYAENNTPVMLRCSMCGHSVVWGSVAKYCPNCGVEMENK